jgi:prepilin-type N-terminal cleavage/methylation domain-containing protein/prepilin-type processing-associated H-X9-DG protein
MGYLSCGRCPGARRRGFTLIELLVVIGIIAVLVSVLLPVLGAARRASVQVKCSASLHQIGDALKMYAIDNKGYWPIVKWAPVPAWIASGDVAARTWQDFLFPYLHRGFSLPTGMFTSDTTLQPELRSDLSVLRGKSPLWGCEAFKNDVYFDPTNGINRYSTGYGMQYYPNAPYATPGFPTTAAGTVTLCFFDASGTVLGRFYKGTEWNKNGSRRGVIADANQFWLYSSAFQQFRSNMTCEPFLDVTQTFVRVDGARHLSPGWTLNKVRKGKGINMLYADGHVVSVDVYEAWNATKGGGTSYLLP